MKKMTKRAVVLVAVLILALTLFAGCGAKTSEEYLYQQYGMTIADKTVTYNGEAQTLEVSIDSSVASSSTAYTVSYVYELKGSTVSQMKDAGTYDVTVQVSEGGEEVFLLEAEFTIEKADLYVEVPDQYVRTGSSATAVSTVFADLELLGSDTISSIGMDWDVDSISSIKAMTELSEGEALGVEITSGNYELEVDKGVLYVLSYADYTEVSTLEFDVTNLTEYNTRFDELTYAENDSYISAATRVLDVFENADDYTAIQLNMLGSIDYTTLSTNSTTATERKSRSYSLDWDVNGDLSDSDLVVTDAVAMAVLSEYLNESSLSTTTTMQIRYEDSDDGDYYSDLRFYVEDGMIIDYEGLSRTKEETYEAYEDEVKYGDTFYLVVKDYNYAYETNGTHADYYINDVDVRDKNYTESSGTPVTYNSAQYTVYEWRVDSSTLGALGNDSSIDVSFNVREMYYINAINTGYSDNANIDYMTIGYSGILDYNYQNEDKDNVYGSLIEGEEYELTVYAKDGYEITSVLLGDFEIDGSEIESGKYEFTVEEDMFDVDAGEYFDIEITTVKKFDLTVKIDNKTTRYSTNSDGTFSSDTGTITLSGFSLSGTSPYVMENDSLTIKVEAADDYAVTSVLLYDSASGGTFSVELIDEFNTSTNSLTIDFDDDVDYFYFDKLDDVATLVLEVTYAEVYTFDVISDDTTFTQNSSGVWVSDFGSVMMLDTDGDIITTLADGQLYTVYMELNDGYVATKVTAGSKSSVSSLKSGGDLTTDGKEFIKDGEFYFYEDGSSYNLPSSLDDDDYFGYGGYSRYDAGEAIEVDIEFDTYYLVDFDNDTPRLDAEMTSSYLYAYGNDYYVFASDDNGKISITVKYDEDWYSYWYKQHTGYTLGTSVDSSSFDDAIYYLYYYIFVGDEEYSDWKFKGSSNFESSSFVSGSFAYRSESIDIDDFIYDYEPGDEILIILDYEVDWD